MQVRHREVFTSIQTEGAILPPDLLQRIFSGDSDLDGLKSKDYHLAEGEKLSEAINRSWNILQGYWRSFQNGTEKLAEGDLGTTLVRERWLLPLFQELGYGRLLTHKAIEIENKTYPISHSWHKTPIHLVGCKVDLDRRMAKVAGASRSSPHSLVQELLNRSDDHLWAFLSNGIRLRILRDNLSLTRQAYVEFDLETMMEGEIYSDFVLLWLLCHQSRVEAEKPEEFWLEKWSKTALEQGTRALDQLRDGVEDAIKALGSGFLKHPLNLTLREKLKVGKLDKQDYYHQILRLIYRLLFLFVAEDRDMLFDPDSKLEGREFFTEYYSTTRLRRMAEKFRGTRHFDLYQGFRLVTKKLGDHGCMELGLPALGSFLFSKNKASPDLEVSEISNEDFLNAIRALAFTLDQDTLRAVDYKNLGSEEFGSVYESLLELHPNLNTEAGTFELKTGSGHERKTTGSYYTPSSLVQCLLDLALDPVLDEAANKPDPENAILNLKICDPACGSGHFLIAAAHRVARCLAAIRTGDEEPAPEAIRTALRDVIGHCIYGVDLNPMAVELCKVALWMESLEPGKPLSFLENKIQCGNSLLGTTPNLLSEGIPDIAFKPIEGDDPDYCSVLRKRNSQELQGQTTMWMSFVAEAHADYDKLSDRYRTLETMDDSSVYEVKEKEALYRKIIHSNKYLHSRTIADAWCAAFIWPKRQDVPGPITQDIFRQLQSADSRVPREITDEIHSLADQYKFFHWHLAFPNIFSLPSGDEAPENEQAGWNGGFDCVLGNPPWELIQVQDLDFFEGVQEITEHRTRAARLRAIEALKENNPNLYRKYRMYLRSLEGQRHLVCHSGKFKFSVIGRINSYKVFLELGWLFLVANNGRLGVIVPSGIAFDDSSAKFFREISSRKSLVSLFDFENRERKFFPEVYYRTRFSLLTLCGSTIQISRPEFAFFCLNMDDLKSPQRHLILSSDDLNLFNPNTRTCASFKSKRDAMLCKSIYETHEVLVRETDSKPKRLWGVQFGRIFNLGHEGDLFIEADNIKPTQLDSELLPLYEGKMFTFYNHRYASVRYVPERHTRSFQSVVSKNSELEDPFFSVKSQFYLPNKILEKRLFNHWKRKWLICVKNVTSATNERTVVGAILPFVPTSYAIRTILGEPLTGKQGACFLAIINSFNYDWLIRQFLPGLNLQDNITKQSPFPDPEIFKSPPLWTSEVLENWISDRCLELTYTSWGLRSFALDCSYEGPPFRWDTERRRLLKAELDAGIFHTYRLKRDDVDYILNSFSSLSKRECNQFGFFRTHHDIIEVYDRMDHAIRTGKPFVSFLDPPPADPSVAHPPRDRFKPPGSVWFLNDLLQCDPTESTIRVQLPEEYRFEGCDSSGMARFRMLKESENMKRECRVVIIRHPELQRGDEKVNIAAGKFYWAEQRDVETGKPLILITLRCKGIPVKLKLSREEWKQFRPLAVLEE